MPVLPQGDSSDQTRSLVDRQLRYFDRRLHLDGFDGARGEVIAHLVASALWLDLRCGNRQAYALVQEVADQLISRQLPQASHLE